MNIKNYVGVIGRLTADPVLSTKTSKPFLFFTVAVSRYYSGKTETDFITCKAWDATAKFISQYFKKGNVIGLTGEIRTSSYEKDGQKINQVFINVDNASFVSEKGSGTTPSKGSHLEDGVSGSNDVLSSVDYEANSGMVDIDITSDDLPF